MSFQTRSEENQQVLAVGYVLVENQPDSGPEGDEGHEDSGNTGHEGILCLVHAQQYGSADEQGYGSQQLVADPEQWPDVADVAAIDEIAPRTGKDEAGDDDAWPPVLVSPAGGNLAQHFLQEEATHAGTCVHSGQDEHGFEHDGEVIPVGHQMLHKGNL